MYAQNALLGIHRCTETDDLAIALCLQGTSQIPLANELSALSIQTSAIAGVHLPTGRHRRASFDVLGRVPRCRTSNDTPERPCTDTIVSIDTTYSVHNSP